MYSIAYRLIDGANKLLVLVTVNFLIFKKSHKQKRQSKVGQKYLFEINDIKKKHLSAVKIG